MAPQFPAYPAAGEDRPSRAFQAAVEARQAYRAAEVGHQSQAWGVVGDPPCPASEVVVGRQSRASEVVGGRQSRASEVVGGRQSQAWEVVGGRQSQA